jgi:peptidyl-prolyl cis-trans isomerase D
MFDFVRKHTKILMSVMFLLIIPSFLLIGLDGYSRYQEGGKAVARVAGHDITQGEWDQAHRAESDRLRASMPNIDPRLLDTSEARYATLERLVRDRVLAQAAQKLTTSDARLARELQSNPTIAALRLPDGKLDMVRYRQLAASQGMTPEGFEARVRNDLSTRQVEAGVIATSFSTPSVADVALNAFFEKREIQLASFTPDNFKAKVNPTDAELDAFYKTNQALFQAPELANIQYVVLDLNSVKKNIAINEADLRAYYDQNAMRLSGNEQRRASHILINANKDVSASDREKARARAEALLLEVRQAPDKFAELAKVNSQDTGSAANGGDLDFFARGAMVKPFEDAAFNLKKGEISDVIESDFGYHIIKLTDVKTPKQRSFEELRASLEVDLKAQQAQLKFAETAEVFTNGVYEQSDNLKSIADRLGLEVKTAANVARTPAPGAIGALANPRFMAALFSPDSLEKKHNTEAVETAPNELTAGRIIQYTAARTIPFSDVRNEVRERVVAARAAELAKKEGQEKLVAWKTTPSTAVMPAAVVVSRDQSKNVPAKALVAALLADASTLPAFVGVDLGPQGFAVIKVNKIVARPVAIEPAATQDRAQYARWWTGAEDQAYFGMLKQRFKAEILAPRPARVQSDSSASVQN